MTVSPTKLIKNLETAFARIGETAVLWEQCASYLSDLTAFYLKPNDKFSTHLLYDVTPHRLGSYFALVAVEKEAKAVEVVSFISKSFEVCRLNRNTVVHSSFTSTDYWETLNIKRRGSNAEAPPKNVLMTLDELAAIRFEIAQLTWVIVKFLKWKRSGDISHLDKLQLPPAPKDHTPRQGRKSQNP